MTIPGTIRGGLIVVAMFCALSTSVVAQISPYPYLSAPHMERGVRSLIDAGMIRRAAADVAILDQTRRNTAVADVVPFDKADILKSSGNRAGADREMDAFLRERTHSPFVPLAWMERAVAALEDGDPEAAAESFAWCARESMIAFEQRRDSFYITMAHKAFFWEGAARASIGQFVEARDVFGASIKSDSLGEYAAYSHYAMGQIYEHNADVHQAINSFGLVRTRYPTSNVSVAARIREAVDLVSLRRPERALDVLTGIELLLNDSARENGAKQIDVDAAREEIALVRAEAYTLRRNYQEALDSCETFITRYPISRYRWHVHLHAGYDALMLGLLDKSLNHYAVILDSLTDDASPIRQQALLYHTVVLNRVGKMEEAVKAFTSLASQAGYPFQAQALIELGQIAYETKDFDRARKALERAERESRDAATSIRAHLLLGATLIEMQQWSKAASAYERAQSIAEEAADEFLSDRQMYLAEIRLKRGICLIQAGQVQPAINALTDFLGNHPNDAHRDEATFWLAESMYRADLLKNAQELYDEIVKRFTASLRREEAMYGLAWTFFRRRDFDRSTSMFGELLRSFPTSRYAAEALARRGDALYILRQFRAAAEQYEQAAATSPTSEEGQYAAYQAGQASYRAGDLSGAVENMRKFMQRYPISKLADDAMYLIGWIAFQQHNEAKAIEDYQRLLVAYPDGDQAVRALYTIGDAQFNLGDVEASLVTYRSVISRYPSHPLASEAAKSMQGALLSLGRTQEALDIADTLINSNPYSNSAEEFAFKKAEIFYSGRNYTNAAAELESYMKRYPSSQRQDEALYLLGKTYLTMNDMQQARAAFVDIEKRFSKSPFIVASKLDLAEHFTKSANATSADSLYDVIWTTFPADTDAASKAGYERAQSARMRGDTARAMMLYRETADRYSGAEYADQSRYQVATLYRKIGSNDSALYHLALLTVRTDKPQFVSNALYDRGTIFLRAKQYESAIADYERVRQEYAGYEDWYTLSLLALGECYESIKRFDEAAAVYEVVLRLRPDDDYGKTADARIKRLKKVRR